MTARPGSRPQSRPAGRLIALEGVDGSGKSLQARMLADALGAVLTFEPGATPLGKALRRMVLDAEHPAPAPAPTPAPAPAPAPRAEALLVAADRAQHVAEVLRPALDAGRWVVTDRFSGSTLAYQGYGRGLPVDELRRLVEWAADGIVADLSVVIDVPTAVARHRLEGGRAQDRLERLDDGFFARVRDGYLTLATSDPARWAVVDGDADPDTVAAEILAVVTERLGGPAA